MFEKLYVSVRVLAKKQSSFKEITEGLIYKGVGRVKGSNRDGKVLRKPLPAFWKKEQGESCQKATGRINTQLLSSLDLQYPPMPHTG